MIILDTNLVSEALKPAPSELVLRWLSNQEQPAMFTTTITVAEVLYGIQALPFGKRRERLISGLERLIANEFEDRVLAFDQDAARVFPNIVVGRQRIGRPIALLDAMIASIARSHGSPVATRNTRDFEHCGVHVVNPWAE